ncbi:MAG: BolA/IbaG family iron-sulfur metabolism protein [Gammaproteobacteria bacterium]|nr:BolA/IbaG family iron-sulfur metabolism protein [Gammaproteobacteria bacterium]MCP4088585.1 BolA/IbaG family iron-sulfur metabolism protein [Gammaproteobacteria bacterium]MCP4276507.1 BolA/IbaG family iron-sulfur metabolism protein [Gammaproteobacteria bacterium]MCP4832384.1 BolA/IbaG family iron-sulfur metabolism protein [Gammaproteobacteria bacterium]MCP4929102.1 BolA/IbaG family iron-sulfur metabolism protein [Gammaproteobacteria bacterium]
MTPTEIEQLISAGLTGCEVSVNTEDNTHFDAVVISTDFAGKRQLQRHQMVYRTLGELMGNEIHALSIQAMTPDEKAGN